MFDELKFVFPFRRYQELILHTLDERIKNKDRKFHVVSPPGSGKTIVGLEFTKRLNKKAVVFAPTSTIQHQWKDKVGMFLQDKKKVADYVSTTPHTIKPINIYTYQLISSPSENLEFVEEMALFRWEQELLNAEIVPTIEDAKKRIHLLKENNRTSYKKELAKYYKRTKDSLIQDNNPDIDTTQFLHPNARTLIDTLVSSGVEVVVMDEAHHLLDYWAFVIKALLQRIKNPILLGLTATPPVTASTEQIDNYLSILGDVDFEIPTPAVVKEGNLAPYQDLVYFCTPTEREKTFINSLQTQFIKLVQEIGNEQSFKEWINKRIILRHNEYGKSRDWVEFFGEHPQLCIAGVKYLTQFIRIVLPPDIIEMEEMTGEISIDDWVVLLNDYSLNYLKLSEKKEDHKKLEEIEQVLKAFGFILTDKGLRQYRSVSDTILALSEAKNQAIVKILQTEMTSMKDELRVIVITDFEKHTAAASKAVEDVLDPMAGGAVRAFKYIVKDPITTELEPILATGTTVLLDSDELPIILKGMEAWKAHQGYTFEFKMEKVDEDIVEIQGEGPDWKPSVYVRMITALLEEGVTKCIVGTRGLFGEGWDSLSINTLIDLTSVTTSMSVNQLRGRSIRLDPKNPRKVANNWDIVCIDPEFERGNQDMERFLRKHEQFYGLGPAGKIVKGYMHVDEDLVIQYKTLGFKHVLYTYYNDKMLKKAQQREVIYDQWNIGEPYQNTESSALMIDQNDITFRTVYRLQTVLENTVNHIIVYTVLFVLYFLFAGPYILLDSMTLFLGLYIPIFLVVLLYRKVSHFIRYLRRPDRGSMYIEDIGTALLLSLVTAGYIDENITVEQLDTYIDNQGYTTVYIQGVSSHDARVFSESMREMFGPVTTQRYLISQSSEYLQAGIATGIWYIVAKLKRLVKKQKIKYYPIPTIFSMNRKAVDILARNWKKYVGGGKVIYTRSLEGEQLLVQLRAYNKHKVKRIHYELWS